eukprot:SAG25_NODE_17_length_24192_cov_70.399452_27_plen_56_part_00
MSYVIFSMECLFFCIRSHDLAFAYHRLDTARALEQFISSDLIEPVCDTPVVTVHL